jgi:aspartate oxidase
MLGGRVLMNEMIREASKQNRIQIFPHFFVYKILAAEDGVSGVLGFNSERKPCMISCKSAVLATGGGGALYKRTIIIRRPSGTDMPGPWRAVFL